MSRNEASENLLSSGEIAEIPGARRELPEAAKRALAEAAERRAARDAAADAGKSEKEIGGAAGPDPVRYGDWEKDGIVSDF